MSEIPLEDLAPGIPDALPGFDYPAPRHPSYLRQERTDDIEELMPLARSHARRRYGRAALGNLEPDDELLVITYPHQHDLVFEALKRALLEEGVKRIDRLDMTDLGMSSRSMRLTPSSSSARLIASNTASCWWG